MFTQSLRWIWQLELFDIKGRKLPEKYVPWKKFKSYFPDFCWQGWKIQLQDFVLRTRRNFLPEDYKLLFDCILEGSKAFVLDAEVSAYSIRYLEYPVNQFFNHVEYILRLIYLYVYYIDSFSESTTVREMIQFLRIKLVEESETIPEHFFNVHPSSFKRVEFTGFPRGSLHLGMVLTEEIEKEVKMVNDMAFPPDEELEQLLPQYRFAEAVRHSRIVDSDTRQLEEFHVKEEWDVIWEQEKKKSRKERSKRKLERSINISENPEKKMKKKKKMKKVSKMKV